MTPLDECVATFRRWMHLPDPGALLITLATVAANRAPGGEPTWLLIIGPPGGGKTETLAPLFGLDYVHPTATLTEAALLSGTPKKERNASAKGGLLREIGDFGILICKDFTSVLSMHREARAAVLAALREIYDGSWQRHLGTGGGITLSWAGKVGLIAGCTPAIDSHHAVMGSMGERFVLYRLPPIDGEAQAAAAMAHIGRDVEMRAELTQAVATVLDRVDLTVSAPSPEDAKRLNALANLAVRCRSAVDRDGYTREIELIPEAEAPARMVGVLLRLLNALRALGVDDGTAWDVLTKTALDSMPSIRRKVMDVLARLDEDAPTSDVAQAIGYPAKTTHRALEDLAVHGVLTRRPGPRNGDVWSLSPWTRARWPSETEVSGAPLFHSPNLEEDFSVPLNGEAA